jgi:DNA-directed DNA polymerase III PolC
MDASITPLHTWSGYSPLRGPMGLQRLVERAAQLGHARLALTDANNLYGATRFHRLTERAGLRAIIGAELRGPGGLAVALVADEDGYENLCHLITRACGDAAFDLADAEDLHDRSAGLRWIVQDDVYAESLLAAGADGRSMYLGIDPGWQRPQDVRRLVRASDRLGLPLAATGEGLIGSAEDHEPARVLAAARCGATIDSVPAAELPPGGAVLRSPRELAEQLADFPHAADNNRRLAEECSAFRLLPRAKVFPSFDSPQGMEAHEHLLRLCRDGIVRRYGQTSYRVEARLTKELDLIQRRGFSEYFLVVWDIVQFARRQGAPVAGRGSGASSLVAYLLGITNVCPLSLDIPFERFLNDRRVDFPDLDLDFCWRIRDDVIDYAFGRWGQAQTAMICTHNTFQERSAFRETAKAFGLSDEQISGLRPADVEGDELLARIGRLSRRIEGLLHNLSVHPGGIVIAPRGIDRHVPVQPAPKGVLITQFDKEGIKDIGLVKLDLLGNRSLSTIRYTCDLIAQRTGQVLDVEALPAGDAATVATLRSADTVGCNQIESPAMRHLLRALEPDGVAELMKCLALIRPGAASIGMKEVFIRRRRGLEPVPPAMPAVDAVLAATHGVMLYEDDVMLVAAAMLGTDLAEADQFRKAVQKCPDDAARLALSREFLARCRENGVEDDYARSMWVQMAKFNAYSFCRAHAASYAMLAYASAYLKTHYPLEFWTACLNNNQSMYHPRVYVEQAKRMGVRFLLPDVNRSQTEFAMDCGENGDRHPPRRVPVPFSPAIRVGFNRVDGLGPVTIQALLDARSVHPFEGLTDCLARSRIGREEARALVLCGALDATGRSRPELMLELNLFFSLRPHRTAGQELLLTAGPSIPHIAEDYSPTRKYADQRRVLGISVREHILELYRPGLAGSVDADSRDLPGRLGRGVRIAGVLEAQRTAQTQTGQTMMFLTMEDEFGMFEVTVFPSTYAALGVLDRYGPYVIAGTAEEQYGSINVNAACVDLLRAKVA